MITRHLVSLDLDPVWTQFTNQLEIGPRLDPVFTPVACHVLPRARAVVSGTSMFSPFRETRDEDTIFPYTCRIRINHWTCRPILHPIGAALADENEKGVATLERRLRSAE